MYPANLAEPILDHKTTFRGQTVGNSLRILDKRGTTFPRVYTAFRWQSDEKNLYVYSKHDSRYTVFNISFFHLSITIKYIECMFLIS